MKDQDQNKTSPAVCPSSVKKEVSAASVGESLADLVYTEHEHDVAKANAPVGVRESIALELLLLDSFLVTEAARRVIAEPGLQNKVVDAFGARLMGSMRETGSPSFAQQYKSRVGVYGPACSPDLPEPAWFEIAREACRIASNDPVYLLFFFDHAVKRYREMVALMRDRRERFSLI